MSKRSWIAAVSLVPALALAQEAEPGDDTPAVTAHINLGAEILGGPSASSGGFRAQALLGRSVGHGTIRPQIAVGATFGTGVVWADDMRALDGSVTLEQTTFGPQLQLGMRFVDGGHVDTRIYLSMAKTKVWMDRRLELDAVPGIVDSKRGTRFAVGINAADAWGQASEDCCKHGKEGELLMIFIPQQLEVAWQRDAGSNRVGVALAWGI